jgi:hypothetical protein
MVSKKTNKILQKDINLLLNKLITIIRKISNSCGNKNKKIKGGGGVGKGLINLLPGYSSQSESQLKKKLKDSIESFLNDEYDNSKKFIEDFFNQNMIYILTYLKKIFAPDLKKTRANNVIFDNHIINEFSRSNNTNILDEIRKNNNNPIYYVHQESNTIYHILFLKGNNDDLIYIALNQKIDQEIDQDIISGIQNEASRYYKLYLHKYRLLHDNDITTFNEFSGIIASVISSWILKFNPENDMLILYYNFYKEYIKILDEEIFDIYVISKLFNSINYKPNDDFYKHLAILNMGNTMKLINYII